MTLTGEDIFFIIGICVIVFLALGTLAGWIDWRP